MKVASADNYVRRKSSLASVLLLYGDYSGIPPEQLAIATAHSVEFSLYARI